MRYISSQMSGIEGYNFDRFDKKALHLRCIGVDVCNPAEEDNYDGNWAKTLARDLVDISENCDEYEPFGAWTHSFGAWLEFLVAIKLGLKIIVPWYMKPLIWFIRKWMEPKPRKLRWWVYDKVGL